MKTRLADREAFVAEVEKLNRNRSGSFQYALQPFRQAFSGPRAALFLVTVAIGLFWVTGPLLKRPGTKSSDRPPSSPVASSLATEGTFSAQAPIQAILSSSPGDPAEAQQYAQILKAKAVSGEVPDPRQVVAAREAVEVNMKAAKQYDEAGWQAADYDLALTELLSRFGELCRNGQPECTVDSLHLRDASFEEGTAELATSERVTDRRTLLLLARSSQKTPGISRLAMVGPTGVIYYRESSPPRLARYQPRDLAAIQKK